MTRRWRRGFALPPTRAGAPETVDEEFRFHLEERRAELIAAGLAPEEADREVARRFGDVEAYRRATVDHTRRALRSQRRAGFVRTLARECRRAVRLLRQERSFAAMAIGTLGLGLAVVLTVFAVVDAVLLRPLPYDTPDRLVAVHHPATVPGSGERIWGLSVGGFVHLREQARTLDALGIYATSSLVVLSGGETAIARQVSATEGVLRVLGARAAHGRLLTSDDTRPGAPPVAVLSAEYHTARFGGDASVIGSLLETADGSFEIVGVTAPGLTVPLPGPFADATDLTGFGVDVWVPLPVNDAGPFYNSHPYVGVARLAAGVSASAATTELSTMLARFPEWMPQAYTASFLEQYHFRIAATPLHDAVVGPRTARVLWLLLAVVLLTCAAAVANTTNLLLARWESRRQEAVVRSALGASTSDLTAHFGAEALLVCGGALLLALTMSGLALLALPWIAPRDIARIQETTLSPAAVALGVALSVAVCVALVAASRAWRSPDAAALRAGGLTRVTSRVDRAMRRALVTAQLATSMMLLCGTVLLLRGALQLRRIDPGFDAAHTLAFEVWLPFGTYDTRERAAEYYRLLDERLRALPGVQAVGFGPVPLQDFGTGCSVVFREGRPYAAGEQAPCVATPVALPGWFETLAIDVRGTRPSWRAVTGRANEVVVTQALADRLWPGEDPIGRGIGSNGPDARAWYRVAGVVPTLRAESLDAPPVEAVFYPATSLVAEQRTDAINYLAVFVRTAHDRPLSLLPAIRDIVRDVDPRVPLVAPRAMETVVTRSLGRLHFLLALTGGAALVVLLLSAVGTYGLIAYVVAQRRAEFGIRMALGATTARVVRLVLSQSVRMALLGIALGIVGAVYSARVLASLAATGGGLGATVVLAVAALLLGTVVVASLLPARRATTIEPVEAMRG